MDFSADIGLIQNNAITNNGGDGIILDKNLAGNLSGNIIDSNKGIGISISGKSDISNNIVTNNYSATSDSFSGGGISVKSSSAGDYSLVIKNNIISGNKN